MKRISYYLNTHPRIVVIFLVIAVTLVAFIFSNENYIAEALGIMFTLILIEWLINGPKRILYEDIEIQLNPIIWTLFVSLITLKGFENENAESVKIIGNLEQQKKDSNTISKVAVEMLSELKKDDLAAKFNNYDKNDYSILSHSLKNSLDQFKEVRNEHLISLDYLEKTHIVKIIRYLSYLVSEIDLYVNDKSKELFKKLDEIPTNWLHMNEEHIKKECSEYLVKILSSLKNLYNGVSK